MADDNTGDPVKQAENKERDEAGRLLPGHTANPNGRPKKGTALTDIMREMMEETPEIKKAIMTRLMKGAADGDIAFIREVLDRLEGKPLQKSELGAREGQSIEIRIVDDIKSDGTDKNS